MTVSSESCGVVYVATGDKFLSEATASAESAKAAMPDVPIALITDGRREPTGPFDLVVRHEEHSGTKRFKQSMGLSPFQRSLFLDTDTYVARDLREVFTVLDRFDLAVNQISSGYHYDMPEVPHCFPELNSGVIAFRDTPEVQALFAEWSRLFDAYHVSDGWTWDQHSFRRALYESPVRFAPLPIEYNFMPYVPAYFMAEVKVLHGRTHDRLVRIAEDVNHKLGARVFYPRIGTIRESTRMSARGLASFWGRTTRLVGYEAVSRTLSRLGVDRDWALHKLKGVGRGGG